jgi:RNA polymerase sigma-70 factor, ECF subfamily
MPHPAAVTTAARDETLAAALYTEYEARIFRYIAARTGSLAEAEDLTSQTFLKALEGLRRGQVPQNETAWLFGIARHVLADHYRGLRKHASLDDADTVANPAIRLDDDISMRMEMERVARALASIAPDRAEALALRIFGNLSTIEVARIMGKSPGAVKVLVFRATQDLRNRLGYRGED